MTSKIQHFDDVECHPNMCFDHDVATTPVHELQSAVRGETVPMEEKFVQKCRD